MPRAARPRHWPEIARLSPVTTAGVDFDATLERYAFGDVQGNVTIRRVADGAELKHLPSSGKPLELAVFQPRRAIRRHGGAPGRRADDLGLATRGNRFPRAVGAFRLRLHPGQPLVGGQRERGRHHPGLRPELARRRRARHCSRTPHPEVLSFIRTARSWRSAVVRAFGCGTSKPGRPSPIYLPRAAWECTPNGVRQAGSWRWRWSEHPSLRRNVVQAACGPQRPRKLVVDLAFSHGEDLLASHAWDNTVRLWDVPGGRDLVRAQYRVAGRLRFSPDDRRLACGRDGTTLYFCEVAAGRECRRLEGFNRHMGLTTDGRLFVHTDDDGVHFGEWPTGKAIGFLPVRQGCYFPNEQTLLTTDGNRLVPLADRAPLRRGNPPPPDRSAAAHLENVLGLRFPRHLAIALRHLQAAERRARFPGRG